MNISLSSDHKPFLNDQDRGWHPDHLGKNPIRHIHCFGPQGICNASAQPQSGWRVAGGKGGARTEGMRNRPATLLAGWGIEREQVIKCRLAKGPEDS